LPTKENNMSNIRSAPIAQVRVIAATHHAQALIAELTERARALIGPQATYRTQTRPAQRIGYVRAYLTVTRKEGDL
jgi:hypothetical protein